MVAAKPVCPDCGSPMQRRLGADVCPACGYEEPDALGLEQPGLPQAVAPPPGDPAWLHAGVNHRLQPVEELAPERPDLRLEKFVFLVFFILRAYLSMQVALQYNNDLVSPLLGGHIEARLLFEIICLGWFSLAVFGSFARFNRFTALACAACGGSLLANVMLETLVGNPFARWLEPLGTDHTHRSIMLLTAGLLQTAAFIWLATILSREGYLRKPRSR
jgi:hypothetical protein